MDWSLLAGGLSKGLEGGLAGANTGLLQSEQIRHQRAQEALQQQHLGLSQQQLQNMQQWREMQNQYNLGRLADTSSYHQGMLNKYGADLAERARHNDIWQQHFANQAPWYAARANLAEQRAKNPAMGAGTGEERWKNGTSMLMFGVPYTEAPLESRNQIDQMWGKSRPGYDLRSRGLDLREQMAPSRLEHLGAQTQRIGLLNDMTRSLLLNPKMGDNERLKLTLATQKIHAIESAMNRSKDRVMMGQPPDPRDEAFLAANPLESVIQDIVRLQNEVATRGFTQANPGVPVPQAQPTAPPAAPTYQDLRKKWLGK